MAKNSAKCPLNDLTKSYDSFMEAITQLEDRTDLDDSTKKQAANIIQQAQIHSVIALETISN